MRKFLEGTTEVLTWLLFSLATFLLARQTYFAMLGQMPDYANNQGALIVAGIVTLTWLAMLGRIVLHLDKTAVDWFISLSLLVSAIAVDIAVALSFVFGWQFPTHLALLVIVAHVVAHVVQWVVSAGQQSFKRFGGVYRPPEERIAELERENALLKQSQAIAEQAHSERTATCQRCGQAISGRGKRGLQNAMNAHSRWCGGKPVATTAVPGGNHRGEEDRERINVR